MNRPKRPAITELLRRAKKGDRQARRQLFERLADEREFGAVMVALTRRLLSRNHPARRLVDTLDVIQSALCTGLRHFSSFRGDTEGELIRWLRTIVRTKVNRAGRRNVPDVRAELDRRQVDSPALPIIERDFVEPLHRAIRRLPLHERIVVELRLRDLNAPQIGRELGLAPATVRKRESRAVKRLKGLLARPSRSQSRPARVASLPPSR